MLYRFFVYLIIVGVGCLWFSFVMLMLHGIPLDKIESSIGAFGIFMMVVGVGGKFVIGSRE